MTGTHVLLSSMIVLTRDVRMEGEGGGHHICRRNLKRGDRCAANGSFAQNGLHILSTNRQSMGPNNRGVKRVRTLSILLTSLLVSFSETIEAAFPLRTAHTTQHDPSGQQVHAERVR